MKELPQFTKQSSERVKHFALQVFTHPRDPEKSYFQEIHEHDDKHFSRIQPKLLREYDYAYKVAMEQLKEEV